jgi:hypothetical protein
MKDMSFGTQAASCMRPRIAPRVAVKQSRLDASGFCIAVLMALMAIRAWLVPNPASEAAWKINVLLARGAGGARKTSIRVKPI